MRCSLNRNLPAEAQVFDQLVLLIWKAMAPIGGGALLGEVGQRDGPRGFTAWPCY